MLLVGAVGSAWGDDYALYSGEITEGDYLIVYNGAAMKAYINNSRLQYTEVTITNNVISNPAADLIWTISKDNVETQYYKLYNSSIEKYAASTGAANKAQLTTTIDKKIRWTITGNSTYEFINQQNLANSVNANLRRNGTYGFACYSTSTGGALSLYKKVGTITEIPTTTTINTTGITNTDVYTSTAAGSLSAIVSAEGNTISGATVTWSSNNTDVATINANGVITLVAAGTVTFTANYAGVSGQYEASSATYEMTVTNSAPIQAESDWVETSLSELTTSDVFVIVGTNSTGNYALANNNGTSAAPTAVSVTISNSYLTSTVGDNIKWTIGGNATDGYTFYLYGNNENSLYCTNSNNGVRVGTNSNNKFTVSDEGYLVNSATSRYIGVYNSADWRCYTSINSNIEGQTFKFYKFAGAPSPSISSSNIDIAFNTTSGIIGYTINNPTTDGILSATTTSEWLTIGTIGENVPFTCSINNAASSREAIVTLTYSYNNSEAITKEVTITQAPNPDYAMTIAEARAQSTGDVITKGVVTSCVGTTAYIQDATAAICVYGETLTVGNEVKVSGTLSTYNGLLEITSPTITVLTEGNTVTPEVMTIAQVNASSNQGWLIKVEEATVTAINNKNVTIAQGENTIDIRFNETPSGFDVNDMITLTGNIGCYNNTAQIANPTDISVIAEPLISVDPTSIEVAFEGEEGNLSVTYENVETDDIDIIFYTSAEATTTTTYSWIDAIFDEMNNVQYTIAANEGAARTAYMKIHGLDSNGGDVYSELITISQGAQVTPVTDVKYVKVTSTDDLASGQYLIVYEEGSVAFNGGLGTLDVAGNTIEVVFNNNEIAATTETTAAEFTIDVTEGTIKSASGYYIGATSYNNELKTNSETAYTNSISFGSNGDAVIAVAVSETQIVTLRYNKASNQTRFRYYKSGQEAVQLYKKVESTPEPETIPVSISAAGYSTLYYGTKNLVVPEGMEAYTVSVTNKLERSTTYNASDVIPAGTGVVLKATQGNYVFAVTSDTPMKDASNLLRGSDEAAETEGGNYYYALTLNSDREPSSAGFYWMEENGAAFTNGAHKAYLALDRKFSDIANGTTTGVKGFLALPSDGIVTAIDSVNENTNADIYNLAGQRVMKAHKGLYIVGGKKILVK